MDQTANAVSGKTAHACDSCLKRRARWFCAADGAFLCQPCDSSVHSANPLASRHERVRLKASSSSSSLSCSSSPSWHHGCRRKVRTPRHAKSSAAAGLKVPDVETLTEEESAVNEELLFQVPVFNPILAEAELAGFADDVEIMLGRGLEGDDAFDIDKNMMDFCVGTEMELSRGFFDVCFDCRSLDTGDEVEEQKVEVQEEGHASMGIGLKMDYDSVIHAWSCRGTSPWTDGVRPQFSEDNCWLNFTGMRGTPIGVVQGAIYGFGNGQVVNVDGGREARVSRYREKRRTRLFSKRIRYEVRKLNAEKRPRMKGRFVKRASS